MIREGCPCRSALWSSDLTINAYKYQLCATRTIRKGIGRRAPAGEPSEGQFGPCFCSPEATADDQQDAFAVPRQRPRNTADDAVHFQPLPANPIPWIEIGSDSIASHHALRDHRATNLMAFTLVGSTIPQSQPRPMWSRIAIRGAAGGIEFAQ